MPGVANRSSDAPGTSSRRGVLATLAGAVTAAALLPRRLLARKSDTKKRRYKWGMVIDLDRCTGCQACVVSCRKENNVALAGPGASALDRGIFWMDMMSVSEGEYPDLHTQFIPTPCNHCENPPCIKVCPVGATRINEDGIVAQIFPRCIGCRYCTTACPYTRRYFNWRAPAFTDEQRRQLNPDVSVRPKGVVEKCTFCHQRVRAAKDRARLEGRELTDEDVRTLPACAQSCPAGAIVFGDLNDPESEVSRLSKSRRAFHLLEELGTHPKVFYLREAKWRD